MCRHFCETELKMLYKKTKTKTNKKRLSRKLCHKSTEQVKMDQSKGKLLGFASRKKKGSTFSIRGGPKVQGSTVQKKLSPQGIIRRLSVVASCCNGLQLQTHMQTLERSPHETLPKT